MGVRRGVRILGIDPGSVVVGFACLEVDAGATVARAEAAAAPGGCGTPLALAAGNVVHRTSSSSARVAAAGVLRLGSSRVPIEDRLVALQRQLVALLERVGPDELALELAFYGKSAGAALRIGEARGVVLATARERGLPVHQFSPARVKRAVTGSGAASKDVVADLVCRQLALRDLPSSRDVTDALAVAFCRTEERRDPRLL